MSDATLARMLEAWIRHGESVPPHVTTYDREIVNRELRDLIARSRETSDDPAWRP